MALCRAGLWLLGPVFGPQGLQAQVVCSGLIGDAQSSQQRSRGVTPAGAMLHRIEIPQVHWTALWAFFVELSNL